MFFYIEILFFCLASVLSMVSQLPFMEETSLGMMFRASWVLPFMPLAVFRTRYFFSRYVAVFFLFAVLFVFYCFACETVFEEKYFGPDVNNVCISFLIFTISHVLYRSFPKRKQILTIVSVVLLVAGSVIAYVVNSTADLAAGLETVKYAYDNKNSMGQILLCCLSIPFMLLTPKSKILNLLKYAMIAYLVVIMFLLKSRATLLSFFYMAGYYTLKAKDKRVRYFVAIALVLVLLTLVLIPSFYELLVKQILLANRDASDMDSASSGRADLYPYFINGFFEHPLFGNGARYFDCMPLIIPYQYGFVGASIFFSFIVYILYKLTCRRKRSRLCLLAYLLFVAYLINSLFEAQPPFGPGIKCAFMWMMVGFSLAEIRKKQSNSSKIKKIILVEFLTRKYREVKNQV